MPKIDELKKLINKTVKEYVEKENLYNRNADKNFLPEDELEDLELDPRLLEHILAQEYLLEHGYDLNEKTIQWEKYKK